MQNGADVDIMRQPAVGAVMSNLEGGVREMVLTVWCCPLPLPLLLLLLVLVLLLLLLLHYAVPQIRCYAPSAASFAHFTFIA